MNLSKIIALILGPTLFAATLIFFKPVGLSAEGISILAGTLWVAVWWISEVIPISVTALLPIVLFPITGGMTIKATTASYGHKFIFLYMGGFIIAIALEKWNLHKRIALNIISFIGTDIPKIIFGFMIATAFLSMWISNTATTVMMLPIGMAIVSQLKENPLAPKNETNSFGKALMLAIAYSASIGGVATLIGTPPNLVFVGVVEELYGLEISFTQWFKFGLPVSVVLLLLCWVYLTRISFNFKAQTIPGGIEEIKRLTKDLGPVAPEEKAVLIVFLTTAVLWIARSYLQNFLPKLDDTIIAITAGCSLFLIPAEKKGRKLITWEEASTLPWGIILLFGGGMALASGFQSSGLAVWIGNQLSLVDGLPIFLLIFVIVAAVNFLTEITSNLATTAMLLPILAPMAVVLDIHPYTLLISATIAASCAFMLPVATPPNAIVFGSGHLRVSDMAKVGLWLNIVSIIFLSLMVYFFLDVVWGLEAIKF